MELLKRKSILSTNMITSIDQIRSTNFKVINRRNKEMNCKRRRWIAAWYQSPEKRNNRRKKGYEINIAGWVYKDYETIKNSPTTE